MFSGFIDKYYPPQYRGKMKNVYQLFRHGLAHNYYPKSGAGLGSSSQIAFGLDEHKRVVPLSRLKRDLDNCRKKTLKLNPKAGKPYVIVPQVLFLDTVNVMELLKKQVKNDLNLQSVLIRNHARIRKILRHRI